MKPQCPLEGPDPSFWEPPRGEFVTESRHNYVENNWKHAIPSNGFVEVIKEDGQITLGNERTRLSYWATWIENCRSPKTTHWHVAKYA
jgi:hypothetical protein